jgi:hypothetical protein
MPNGAIFMAPWPNLTLDRSGSDRDQRRDFGDALERRGQRLRPADPPPDH